MGERKNILEDLYIQRAMQEAIHAHTNRMIADMEKELQPSAMKIKKANTKAELQATALAHIAKTKLRRA